MTYFVVQARFLIANFKKCTGSTYFSIITQYITFKISHKANILMSATERLVIKPNIGRKPSYKASILIK